jgi:myosin-5
MSYRKGLKVWVEEKGEGWVEAEVAEAKERAVVVLTSQRKKVHRQPTLPPSLPSSIAFVSFRAV